jgi:hypothetical protein
MRSKRSQSRSPLCRARAEPLLGRRRRANSHAETDASEAFGRLYGRGAWAQDNIVLMLTSPEP